MPISYDVEKDGLYLRGVEKGIGLGIEKGINLGVTKSAWKVFKAGKSIKFISEALEISIPKVEASIKEWEGKS